MKRESWCLPIVITPRRMERLKKAARMLPRRRRRAAERQVGRRILTEEEVLERFLDSNDDGVEQWARRHAG